MLGKFFLRRWIAIFLFSGSIAEKGSSKKRASGF